MNFELNPHKEEVPGVKRDWKRHFTTVTPLSKGLAMVLFIALPFVGFWLGQTNESTKSVSSSVCESPTEPQQCNDRLATLDEELQQAKTSVRKTDMQLRQVNQWLAGMDVTACSEIPTVDGDPPTTGTYPKNNCITAIAVAKEDADLCSNISDTDSYEYASSRDLCYMYVADRMQDVTICARATDWPDTYGAMGYCKDQQISLRNSKTTCTDLEQLDNGFAKDSATLYRHCVPYKPEQRWLTITADWSTKDIMSTLDVSSFEHIGSSYYRDINYVYYFHEATETEELVRLRNADVGTFHVEEDDVEHAAYDGTGTYAWGRHVYPSNIEKCEIGTFTNTKGTQLVAVYDTGTSCEVLSLLYGYTLNVPYDWDISTDKTSRLILRPMGGGASSGNGLWAATGTIAVSLVLREDIEPYEYLQHEAYCSRELERKEIELGGTEWSSILAGYLSDCDTGPLTSERRLSLLSGDVAYPGQKSSHIMIRAVFDVTEQDEMEQHVNALLSSLVLDSWETL